MGPLNSRSSFVRALALAVLCLISLVGPVAWADPKQIDELSQSAKDLRAKGRYSEATPLAERALAMALKEYAEDHPVLGVYFNRLANLYKDVGRFDDAERTFKQAIAVREKADSEQLPDSLNDLGLLYWDTGRYHDAERLLKDVLGQYTRQFGPGHEYVATAATNLGLLYRDMGQFEEAEKVMLQGRRAREKLNTPHQREDLSNSLNSLAGLYREMGRIEEAEPLARQTLTLRISLLGKSHPDVATTMNVLAEILRQKREFGEAEQHLKEALAIRREVLGPEHPRVATTLNSLGGIYESRGALREAEEAYKAALAIRVKQLRPRYPLHPDLATSQANLGGLYKSQYRYSEAEPLLRSALEIREKTLGTRHPDYLKSLLQWGDFLRARGKSGEADQIFERALSIRRAAIRQIDVLFATNRQKIEKARTLSFGSGRAKQMSFGVATVMVPVEDASRASARVASAAPLPRMLRISESETTEMARLTIRTKVQLSEADYFQKVGRASSDAPVFRSQALLFVHGFNVSFDNAVKRAAQIAYDLRFDGPVIVFTWPSRGSDTLIGQVLGVFDYTSDAKSSEISSEFLSTFLMELPSKAAIGKLHVIAHSMGNKALLDALKTSADRQELTSIPLGSIILAAPDVEKDIFELRADALRNGATILTLYASASDRALMASERFWRGAPAGYVTPGGEPVLAKNVESIDITEAGDSFLGLNHDVFATNPQIAADMHLIIARGTHPPEERSGRFKRMPSRAGSGVYWRFNAAPIGNN